MKKMASYKLTERCLERIDELSEKLKLAKGHVVELAINELYESDPKETRIEKIFDIKLVK